MAFREVSVVEIRELLRLWLQGKSARTIARLSGVHRETVANYVDAARIAGLEEGAAESAITEALLAEVIAAQRPARRSGHGTAWEVCVSQRDWIQARLGQQLTLTKTHALLERERGVVVPYSTLHRFAKQQLGFGRDRTTVRIADCAPGAELQVDFGYMGPVLDPVSGKRRRCDALIFTSVFSRHQFVWMSFSQSLPAVIAGFEAAWQFFGGVFACVIPDNVKAIVDRADPITPRINTAFLEYAQSRGFVIDPARVRHPKDKPRVERQVQYVRSSMFAGETFTDLEHAQRHAAHWCASTAGLRIHRTIQRRPAEVFTLEEQPVLLALPADRYDLPVYREAKVHRDCHIEVERALYSVPHGLVGQTVAVRADSQLVRISHRGAVVKIHTRTHRGGRVTDPDDLPSEKQAYAMRDIESLKRWAAEHGDAIGVYAAGLLDIELPWTKMRQVYRLLGLVRRYGPERVEAACRKALDVDVVDVSRVQRMLERALETDVPAAPAPTPPQQTTLRFARDAAEFAVEPVAEQGGAS
jgi:transposase